MSDRRKVYIKYIDEICSRGDFSKEILTFFIENNGRIEDIIQGIEVLIEGNGEICELSMPTSLTLKKDIVCNNLLYNIASYCVLNNAELINNKSNKYKLVPFLIKNKIFNNNTFIRNSYDPENGSYFIIEFSINDITPDKCDCRLLDSDSEDKIFNDFIESMPNADFFDGSYNYVVDVNISLTNCLNSNMLLIKNWIDNLCIGYINKADELKEYNKKYFTKQIIQRNVNDF